MLCYFFERQGYRATRATRATKATKAAKGRVHLISQIEHKVNKLTIAKLQKKYI